MKYKLWRKKNSQQILSLGSVYREAIIMLKKAYILLRERSAQAESEGG